ncbi:MAG TPA: hypothetical protein VHL11_14610 [Phototrophicaceae bacterium]|jgi:hypothetical protein|nr:hypothetical protein [Phototrophicaceae bacterium]
MTKTYYTPDEKVAALQRLRENMGDLPLTSRQLSIPERTLRTWRQDYRAFKTLMVREDGVSPAASEPVDQPPHTDTHQPLTADAAADEFENLRLQLMDQVMQLSADFPDSMESATHRASAIARLLTWVFKLDEIIPSMRPVQEYVYRVEYKDPDGSLHPTPPWQRHKSVASSSESGEKS